MHIRTLVLTRDDPTEPGLLIRRYVRIRVCWDVAFSAYAWQLLNAAEEAACPMIGPFPAGESAFEDALARYGGTWEAEEVITPG